MTTLSQMHVQHEKTLSGTAIHGLQALPFVRHVMLLPTAHLPAGVQVWQLMLARDAAASLVTEQQYQQLLTLLAVDERARCKRYHRLADRIRYAVMRAALRHLIAHHLQQPAHCIQLGLSAFGKPCLRAPAAPLQFNLSHSQQLGLIALSAQRPVGIDIEALASTQQQRALLSVFSPREQAYCLQHPHATDWTQIWTGKEAVLKALGTGLTAELTTLSVLPMATHLEVSLAETKTMQIQAWPLAVAYGYQAALALL